MGKFLAPPPPRVCVGSCLPPYSKQCLYGCGICQVHWLWSFWGSLVSSSHLSGGT